MFIMTIRNKYKGTQMKVYVRDSIGVIRLCKLYPESDHIIHEIIYTKADLMNIVTCNLAENLRAKSGVNVYFNGENYTKFVNSKE